MDLDLIWKAILVVLGGTLLLRIAGRKSISQMSLAQVVIMVGIGSLLVQPIVGKSIWSTLMVGLVLVLSLVVVEYLQIKVDWIEKFITGRAKILVKNGELQTDNLKKLRLTVDQLEMKLRQNQIRSLSDVEEVTLEPNGQVGFILKENNQPSTKSEIHLLKQEIHALRLMVENVSLVNTSRITPSISVSEAVSSSTIHQENDLFSEVETGTHMIEPPEELK
nr:YetF domain-containing protein [Bacillus sp. Marseille-Q1617]